MGNSTAPTSTKDQWLTIPQLAQELQVTVSTIYQWRYKGEGPRGARFGRYIRFRRSDVDAWMAAQMEPVEPPRTA